MYTLDKFYAMITGTDDAFYQICMQLPETIDNLIADNKINLVKRDTVVEELQAKNPDMLKSLYLLAFETYEGFGKMI